MILAINQLSSVHVDPWAAVCRMGWDRQHPPLPSPPSYPHPPTPPQDGDGNLAINAKDGTVMFETGDCTVPVFRQNLTLEE